MSKVSTGQIHSTEEQIVSGLLNIDERWVCEQIATGTAPWSQRAQALLKVDEGASDIVAGEITGLRATQVKYWVDAFRRQGTEIFPKNIMMELEKDMDVSDSTVPGEEAPAVESPGKAKKSKKADKTKGKKQKATKKKDGKGKKKKLKGKKKAK